MDKRKLLQENPLGDSIDPRPFLYIEKQIGTLVGRDERDRIAIPDLNDIFQSPLRIWDTRLWSLWDRNRAESSSFEYQLSNCADFSDFQTSLRILSSKSGETFNPFAPVPSEMQRVLLGI